MYRRYRALAVAVLLALSALGAAACDVMFQGMNAHATDQWRRTYKLEPGGQFEVISPNGTIDVTPSADASTVEVVAERRAFATTEDAAREELKKIQIDEQATSTAVRLEVRRPSEGVRVGRRMLDVRFHIKVPSTTAVKVDTRNGEVHVAGLAGAVKIDATNGDIVGENLAGALQVGTTNGRIRMQVAKIQPDGISLETTNGTVELQMPADAKATIEARWVNGTFETNGLKPEGTKERRRYQGTLNGGGPRVRLSTTNGLIRISS